MNDIDFGVEIPPEPNQEGKSTPRILVLVPDAQGGIRSIFMQLQAFTQNVTRTSIVFFASHDNQKNGLLRFPLRLVRFAHALTSNNFNLCHINLSIRGSTLRKVAFALVCRVFGVKYIVHLHGGRYPDFYRNLSRPIKAIVRSFFSHAQHTIVLGTVWKDYVVSTIGVDPSKVTILPNAVYGPEKTPTRDDNIPPHIVFLGKLGVGKGVPELLQALTSPQIKKLSWTATLAGDGDVARYQALAQSLGLTDRVAFPGWVGPQDAQKLLETGHILVLPSHAENLPLSMLEGMGYGLCPVVTPVGAVTDVIRDGENGLLVPVGNADALATALAEVIADPEIRNRLGAQARADFEANYDIRDYREKLETIYLDVMAQSKT